MLIQLSPEFGLSADSICVYARVYACVCVCAWLVVSEGLKSWLNIHLPCRAEVSVLIFAKAHQAIRGLGIYFA